MTRTRIFFTLKNVRTSYMVCIENIEFIYLIVFFYFIDYKISDLFVNRLLARLETCRKALYKRPKNVAIILHKSLNKRYIW